MTSRLSTRPTARRRLVAAAGAVLLAGSLAACSGGGSSDDAGGTAADVAANGSLEEKASAPEPAGDASGDTTGGSAGTRSAKEDAFLETQTTEPLVNVKIEVDFHWPDERRIVEVDGPPHDRLATQREDARRDAALEAAGWDVTRAS